MWDSIPFQAVDRSVSAGLIGLGLLLLYWKTRNIWACGILHSVCDLLLMLNNCIFDVPGDGIHYESTGEISVLTVVILGILILTELFILWRICRKTGTQIDFQKIIRSVVSRRRRFSKNQKESSGFVPFDSFTLFGPNGIDKAYEILCPEFDSPRTYGHLSYGRPFSSARRLFTGIRHKEDNGTPG